MATDRFAQAAPGKGLSTDDWEEIDVSSADHTFTDLPDQIYLGAEGDVRAEMRDGRVMTFQNMAAGVEHGISFHKIFTTGTTATGIKAGYNGRN